MKILLAHHYWQHNANAVWNPGRFPYPAIEDEIKKNYSLLEAERPAWKQYGDVTVFFDYRPGKDIYGRDIVPISFAFLPGCQNPAACVGPVMAGLAVASTSQLSMDVELPAGCLPIKRHYRLGVIVAACAMAVILAVWLFSGGKKEEKSAPAQVSETKNMQVTGIPPANPNPAVLSQARSNHVYNPGRHVQQEPVEEARAEAASPDYEVDKDIQELCDNDDFIKRELPIKCFQKYFRSYCNRNLKLGENYEEWKVVNECYPDRSSIKTLTVQNLKDNGFSSVKEPTLNKFKAIFDRGVENGQARNEK